MHFVSHFVSNFKPEIVAIWLIVHICLVLYLLTYRILQTVDWDDDHSYILHIYYIHNTCYARKPKAYTTIFKLICVKEERKKIHQSHHIWSRHNCRSLLVDRLNMLALSTTITTIKRSIHRQMTEMNDDLMLSIISNPHIIFVGIHIRCIPFWFDEILYSRFYSCFGELNVINASLGANWIVTLIIDVQMEEQNQMKWWNKLSKPNNRKLKLWLCKLTFLNEKKDICFLRKAIHFSVHDLTIDI